MTHYLIAKCPICHEKKAFDILEVRVMTEQPRCEKCEVELVPFEALQIEVGIEILRPPSPSL